ncbi:MBL fold metallo-hydrolase [Streptomyces sp. 1331.2]|uniref:MBL fold metallo-hydrolase n=1 Tax=Streptomyces sp. 1331.2 TaxID=1938835 RepID=UPI000BCA47DD|nr:MBL fold metallo-hydrolase [Streptomyces sp. 1331.2]SOB79274.1 Glyoxylase, beta-lactamase superfamily II [Streptomyces sp. 1331.2]
MATTTRSDGPETWSIDDRCTNCDVARQLAPGLIREQDGRSALIRQPRDEAERRQLRAAAHACPTRSIRPGTGLLDPATDPFPLALTEEVLLLGHNSRMTAGANSYLCRRPTGWVMIDTPRYSTALADRYAALGPVTDVLLTHRDHARHGREYADRLGARLWIHEGDLDAAPDADRVLRGTEPVEIAPGLVAHPFPGHTLGSVLYVAEERYCFSGDSLYWSRTTGDVEVQEAVTWYSIEEQAASLARSLGVLRFEWLLPGHGERHRMPAEEADRRLRALAARCAQLRPGPVDFGAVRW